MRLLNVKDEEKFKVLKENPYFHDLNEKILSEIITGMRLNNFERDEIIFWEGDESSGLYMIRKGSVKLFKLSPQGRELVIKVFDQGATFNEVPVFDHQPDPVNVAALEDCELWIIDAEVIRKCISRYPEMAQSVISNLCLSTDLTITWQTFILLRLSRTVMVFPDPRSPSMKIIACTLTAITMKRFMRTLSPVLYMVPLKGSLLKPRLTSVSNFDILPIIYAPFVSDLYLQCQVGYKSPG